jgi:hypothetical protein
MLKGVAIVIPSKGHAAASTNILTEWVSYACDIVSPIALGSDVDEQSRPFGP